MSERDDINLTPEEEQRIQASVRALGEVRADEAFRARLREQFMAGMIPDADGEAAGAADERVDLEAAPTPEAPPKVVAMPAGRTRRRPVVWAVLPAIAAALAIIFLGGGDAEWRLQDVRGSGEIVVAGQTVAVDARTDLSRLISGDTSYEVPEGAEMDLALDDIMVVGVAGPTSFTLRDVSAEHPQRFEAVVDGGEFRFKSGPAFPGHEMIIRTSEGDAVVTGTTVAVFKDPEVTCVCVLEGTVMIGKDGDHMDAVPAGMRKVMFADGREPMIIAIEPGHRDGLIDFERLNTDTFAE